MNTQKSNTQSSGITAGFEDGAGGEGKRNSPRPRRWKLNWETARYVRKRHAEGALSAQIRDELAQRGCEITRQYIFKIVNGYCWREEKAPEIGRESIFPYSKDAKDISNLITVVAVPERYEQTRKWVQKLLEDALADSRADGFEEGQRNQTKKQGEKI